MEQWLKRIVRECEEEAKISKNAQDLKKPAKMSFGLEVGEQKFSASFDVAKMMRPLILPMMLFGKATQGIGAMFSTLENMELKFNQQVRGYSGSRYEVPFVLEDAKRLVIVEPQVLPSFLEVFGFPAKVSMAV